MLPTYAISVSSTSVLLARYAWVAATHGLHVTRVKLMVAGVKEVFEEEVRAVSEIPKLPLFFFFHLAFLDVSVQNREPSSADLEVGTACKFYCGRFGMVISRYGIVSEFNSIYV